MRERELISRITIKDCEVQTFSCGGHGGQNRDRRATGVRVIHHPSGAVGSATDTRYQLQNKRLAFRRMAESQEFRAWTRRLVQQDLPESRSSERVRTYNMIERYVKDHRTDDRTSAIEEVLDGNVDVLYR